MGVTDIYPVESHDKYPSMKNMLLFQNVQRFSLMTPPFQFFARGLEGIVQM